VPCASFACQNFFLPYDDKGVTPRSVLQNFFMEDFLMKKIILVVALSLLAVPAFSKMVYRNSPAGCGLGTLVIQQPDGIVLNVLQSTTNNTFGTQTFGMTFGTSNCHVAGHRTASAYIEANRVALSNDISRGGGETLNTLCEIWGCANPNHVATTLQKNYRTIFPTANTPASTVETRMTSILKTQASGSCNL
jgi:hypothetical protein